MTESKNSHQRLKYVLLKHSVWEISLSQCSEERSQRRREQERFGLRWCYAEWRKGWRVSGVSRGWEGCALGSMAVDRGGNHREGSIPYFSSLRAKFKRIHIEHPVCKLRLKTYLLQLEQNKRPACDVVEMEF